MDKKQKRTGQEKHGGKEMPLMLKIFELRQETGNHYTLFFKHKMDYKPGQFVMLWLPGVEEKPFSLSYHDSSGFGITIEKKGDFTERLSHAGKGTLVGIRGPYGNGFSTDAKNKKVCIVAGGCGMAPLSPLIEKLKSKKPVIIQGARTEKALLFQKRFKRQKIIFCTDDGSFGRKGFVTEALSEVLSKNKINMVYTCGPEMMMKRVVEVCENRKVKVQASLERMMHCGFGICGSCTCDGMLVCKDGPVFNSKHLRKMSDFGRYAKLHSGKRVSLTEYANWRSK